jgi:hypothetical protein
MYRVEVEAYNAPVGSDPEIVRSDLSLREAEVLFCKNVRYHEYVYIMDNDYDGPDGCMAMAQDGKVEGDIPFMLAKYPEEETSG